VENFVINSDCSNTAWMSTAVQPPYAIGEWKTMNDVITPGFRRIQREGGVAFNPMTMSRDAVAITVMGYGQQNKRLVPAGCPGTGALQEGRTEGPAVIYYAGKASPPSYPTPFQVSSILESQTILDLRKEVITKVLADRGKGDNNLFESIAEYKRTLAMLSSGINRFWSFISRNESYLKGLTPAGAWLGMRYGILPLVRDIESIYKGVQKKVGKRRVTTRARKEYMRSEVSSYNTGSVFGTYSVQIGIQTTEMFEVRAMSLDEYVADVYSNVGLSFKGFITTPWELIPYSFVVDWFANVGDFINALAPAPGYDQLGSALTQRQVQSSIITVEGLTVLNSNFPNVRMPVGQFTVLKETKTRGNLGLPGIVWKADFRLDNAIRLADGLSLLVQKMTTILGGRR
jgi:hypothetical protein